MAGSFVVIIGNFARSIPYGIVGAFGYRNSIFRGALESKVLNAGFSVRVIEIGTGIIDPCVDNSYDDIRDHAGELMRTMWMAVTCGDLVTKFLYKTRPYEVNPGQAEAVYRQCVHDFEATISRQDLSVGKRYCLLIGLVEQLDHGLETVVGSEGRRLSTGQAQRIAMARCFLRDAPILMLDEPTAHLDSETEAGLSDAIARAAAGRTAIVVSHRNRPLETADRVLSMRAGRLEEITSPSAGGVA